LKLFLILFYIIIIFIIILTVIPVFYSYNNRIFTSIDKLPEFDIVCLLGARVYPENNLSPVLKQRCDTIIKFNKEKKIKILFVSGSWKYEVNNIVKYITDNGVDDNIIIKDYFGFDTHDSIKHLKELGYNNVLYISQKFHLFRVIDMSINDNIEGYGLAAEKICPVVENLPLYKKYYIKIKRYYKNSFLFFIYKLGIYDKLSRESEDLKKRLQI